MCWSRCTGLGSGLFLEFRLPAFRSRHFGAFKLMRHFVHYSFMMELSTWLSCSDSVTVARSSAKRKQVSCMFLRWVRNILVEMWVGALSSMSLM